MKMVQKSVFQHLQNIQSCSSWFCIIEDLRSLLGLLTWLSCNPWSIMSLSSSRTGKKSLPISIIKICIPKCQHSCSKKFFNLRITTLFCSTLDPKTVAKKMILPTTKRMTMMKTTPSTPSTMTNSFSNSSEKSGRVQDVSQSLHEHPFSSP